MSEDGYSDGSDVEDIFASDDEDDSYPESPLKVDKGKQKDEFIYHSFSPLELRQELEKATADVVGILGVEQSVASILLQQFRWNKERLMDAYMDSPDATLESSGVPPVPIEPPKKRPRITPVEFVCDICCDAPLEAQVHRERCGHAFCTSCWETYATGKIKDEGDCIVTCMQEGCPVVLGEDTIKSMVNSQSFERYRALVNESFVNVHSYLRFCPSPGCDQVISCHGATSSALLTYVPTVTCASAHTFCFGCEIETDHRPVICAIAKLWLKNAKEDSGTSQWIQANTKRCPRCDNPTEKNGGCNRILCRQCQFQWCWMCQKNWDIHGYNATCNAFVEPGISSTSDTLQSQAKVNLQKWLFYYDRFTNHELSATLDHRLYMQIEKKMVEVQNTSGLSWIEARFMKNAVDELKKCRATLKWTYAMAFFIQKGNMKQIFEDVQADLEAAVETLSEMLEEDVSAETVHVLRQRMTDKTVYVQKRHLIVLDDTAKGLQEGRWTWTVPVE